MLIVILFVYVCMRVISSFVSYWNESLAPVAESDFRECYAQLLELDPPERHSKSTLWIVQKFEELLHQDADLMEMAINCGWTNMSRQVRNEYVATRGRRRYNPLILFYKRSARLQNPDMFIKLFFNATLFLKSVN